MKLKRPDLVGDLHTRLCQKISKIFSVQKGNYENARAVSNGIRGFLLYGPPGTGKSTIARAVIYDTVVENGLEHFPDEQLYSLLNLADLARSRFGETEDIIRTQFRRSMAIARETGGFFITVMDDVDGMFPSRSYQRLDAWYLGHLNVLFTELDDLETDKVGVIMTTNRLDLLDDAVLSRLVAYEVPFIEFETARIKISHRIQELGMSSQKEDAIIEKLESKLETGAIKQLSFRDVEKEIIFQYLEWIESQEKDRG